MDNLKAWAPLLNFRPPESVKRSLKRGWWRPNFTVQPIEKGVGDVNLDFYTVRIKKPPTINGRPMSPEEFVNQVRRNFSELLGDGVGFRSYSKEYSDLWANSDPTGSVMVFDLQVGANVDDGAVVVSRWTPRSWIFSTIWTPDDMWHPVNGNREFGVNVLSDGSWDFYTRGADRASGVLDDRVAPLLFAGGDRIWLTLRQNIAKFVTANGGAAEVGAAISKRHDWHAVKAVYFDPDAVQDAPVSSPPQAPSPRPVPVQPRKAPAAPTRPPTRVSPLARGMFDRVNASRIAMREVMDRAHEQMQRTLESRARQRHLQEQTRNQLERIRKQQEQLRADQRRRDEVRRRQQQQAEQQRRDRTRQQQMRDQQKRIQEQAEARRKEDQRRDFERRQKQQHDAQVRGMTHTVVRPPPPLPIFKQRRRVGIVTEGEGFTVTHFPPINRARPPIHRPQPPMRPPSQPMPGIQNGPQPGRTGGYWA